MTLQRNLLIVEDDSFKLDRIRDCLEPLRRSFTITVARSVQAAVAMIADRRFDFILLDMSLPTHDPKPGGGTSTSLLSGGLEVIMELAYLNRQDEVIVITQYPEVEIEGELISIANVQTALERTFHTKIKHVILYQHEYNSWEADLLLAVSADQ